MTVETGISQILGFEKQANKDALSGYAGLSATGLISDTELAANSASGVIKFDFHRDIPHIRPKAASDNLQHVHDAGVTTDSMTYVLLKTFTFALGIMGMARIKFDAKNFDFGVTNYVQVYRNGDTLGTEEAITTSGYTTFTKDLTITVDAAGTIALYGKASSGIALGVKNFRIYYDNAADTVFVTGVTTS